MSPTRLATQQYDECRCCGSKTTQNDRRLYGDNNDILHRCRKCDTSERLRRGSGAGVNVDLLDDPLEEPQRYRHSNNLPPMVVSVDNGGETA
ncbi:DUF7563 family protein [Natranaeroarchaeum sulfidigenes]|uniref:DUF7563 family protein n=1 Tax=Natranaeroarchaeum sulfidigenes TaxID=2784880 RepID=UPI001EE5F69A|nr:hypothetical protein [Natranaeroarchaeum sulfidigenes]